MSNTKLLRQQLAKFAPDPRTLRALEQALEVTQIVTPDYIAEVSTAAASAEATAVQALGQIEALAQDVTVLAGAADTKAGNALQQLVSIAQDAAINAAAAEIKAQTALSMLKDAQQSIALLEQAPPVEPAKRKRYGVFHDTTTQTAAAINTAYGMTFNTTEITNGVYIGATTSRIYVDEGGIYNIQFSAQVQNTSGGTHSIWIWLRINGVDQDSATKIRIVGNNTEAVAAWNFVYMLKAGDYFELMWAVDDTSVQLLYAPAAAPVPLLPSIILTVCDNIS